MKSLAFAADAEELIFLYGFSMPVSPFDRLGSSRSQIVAGGVLARRSLLSRKPGISQLRKARLEHAAASAAPAASSKSPFHQLRSGTGVVSVI
jgi:hypothetical protein